MATKITKEYAICIQCGIERHRDLFIPNRNSKNFKLPCAICRETNKLAEEIRIKEAQGLFRLGYKYCSMCKEVKELHNFSNNKNSRDGKQGWCQQCMNKKRQEWANSNPDRDKELKDRFKQTDKYKIGKKNIKYKRREKLNKTPKEIRLTARQWKDVLEKYNHKCLSCGTTESITIDHIKPLSMGGMNTANNVQPLCHTCNSLKRDLEIDYRPEFLLLSSDYEHDILSALV